MPRRLSRFRYLEWARSPKSHAADPSRRSGSDRFEALEPEPAPRSEDLGSAPGHLTRFGEAGSGELLLHDRNDADQPFVRCARCGTDSGRFAASCTACGAELDTPQQRAFNEELWAKEREQRELEREERRAREQAYLEEAAHTARQRRARYEELARQVGRQTRERLRGDPSRPDGLPLRTALALAAVVGALLVASAIATGGTRALVRVGVMAAIVAAIFALRWILRR